MEGFLEAAVIAGLVDGIDTEGSEEAEAPAVRFRRSISAFA